MEKTHPTHFVHLTKLNDGTYSMKAGVYDAAKLEGGASLHDASTITDEAAAIVDDGLLNVAKTLMP